MYQNIDQLPIKKFDYLTLWGVLEHLPSPVETLVNLKKLMKEDSFIAITTVDAEGLIPYYFKPPEHLTYWTRSAFECLFEQIGFDIVEYSPYEMIQKSDTYVDRLISRTPQKYREAFKKSIKYLPDYVEIPTNEIFVVGKLSTK